MMHHLHLLLISEGVLGWLGIGLVSYGFYNAWHLKIFGRPAYAILVFSLLFGPLSLMLNLGHEAGWSLRRRRKGRPYNTYMKDRRRRHDDDGCDPDL